MQSVPRHHGRNRRSALIRHGPRDRPRVALTFDDGPGPNTARLLDVLAEHGARSTHFVVGERVADGAAELRRAVAEGHELGNHSWSHPDLTAKPELAAREMRRTSEAIEEATGTAPRWFRPPFGRGADSLVVPAAEAGLEVALWDVDARDWGERDPEAIVERVLQSAEGGSVVVMHDQADDAAGATLAAISEIAPLMREEGLEMVTLARLLHEA